MDRYHFNAVVSDEDLVEVYLPAFRDCMQTGRVSALLPLLRLTIAPS